MISSWYPDDATGVKGSFVRQQALAVSGDHDVRVLHLRGRHRGEGRLRLDEENDGPLRTLRVRGGWPPVPTTAVNLWAAAEAARRLRRAGWLPDLFHAHEFDAGFAAVVLGRLLRRPVVISEHSSDFSTDDVHGAAAWIARRAFSAADLVCPVSDSLRIALEQGGWGGRYAVVPNVVDTEIFAPGPPRDDDAPARALAVASLTPVKGVGDLVEALGTVASRRSDFSVDLVGDGPLRGMLEQRAGALALNGRLSFRGTLPRTRVAELMRRASFVVVCSRWETFSVVLSEAMACGLPVLATNVGALPERIHEGNGILCPAGDPAALAAAFEEMLERHREYDRSAIADEVRGSLAPDVVAQRWREIYVDVVS